MDNWPPRIVVTENNPEGDAALQTETGRRSIALYQAMGDGGLAGSK